MQEMQQKLENLRSTTSYPMPVQSNQSLNRILAELRDQQRINEAALSMLRQRLQAEGQQSLANSAYVSSVRSSNTNMRQAVPLAPSNFTNSYNGNYSTNNFSTNNNEKAFNNYNDLNLSNDEIRFFSINNCKKTCSICNDWNFFSRIMRLNYLQGGGSDQSILNKFTELEFDVRNRNPSQYQRRSSQQNYSQNHSQIGNFLRF